jgi:hypothetical protein
MNKMLNRRIIIDAPPADFEKCLGLAREAIRSGEEGDEWGYWSSADPDFQALIRFNKASISVNAIRKEPSHDA